MNTDWHYIHHCTNCNHNFGEGPDSVHLMFGFSKPCPSCGEDIGSNYINRTTRKLVRWVRPIPFKFTNIKTWFVDYRFEEKTKV